MTKDEFSRQALLAERTLYCVARTYLTQEADCADCVQEALVRAWRAQGTLREERYFRTWLIRILINECKKTVRDRRRLIPTETFADSAAPDSADGEIYALLKALPEKYRVPAVMHYVGGYSLEEIGRALRLPMGTVKNRLFRAREKLKISMQEEAL